MQLTHVPRVYTNRHRATNVVRCDVMIENSQINWFKLTVFDFFFLSVWRHFPSKWIPKWWRSQLITVNWIVASGLYGVMCDVPEIMNENLLLIVCMATTQINGMEWKWERESQWTITMCLFIGNGPLSCCLQSAETQCHCAAVASSIDAKSRLWGGRSGDWEKCEYKLSATKFVMWKRTDAMQFTTMFIFVFCSLSISWCKLEFCYFNEPIGLSLFSLESTTWHHVIELLCHLHRKRFSLASVGHPEFRFSDQSALARYSVWHIQLQQWCRRDCSHEVLKELKVPKFATQQ